MGFKFYNIWIIQSLPHGKWSTGRHLFHALRELPGVEEHVLLEIPSTKVDFLEVLRKIDGHLKQTGRIPLIHIEAHLSNPDLREGVKILNTAVEDRPNSYRLWPSELIFCQA